MPDTITIFHNPHCSKSRAALELITAHGAICDVVEYVSAPPDDATLRSLVARYKGPIIDLVRVGDAAFRELGVDTASLTTESSIVDLLLAHPGLMQRPLLARGNKVIIGRPTERVAELLA
jgi:arsenate reductase (glutaredoxin)